MTRRMVMKRTAIKAFAAVLLLVLVSVEVRAQVLPFETIINNGSSQNRVDIAVLGDGYTAAQTQQYRTDVQTFIAQVFNNEPLKEYQRYFNVHRIDVVSNQSGADHPENGTFVDTALDATYNCQGILRLICVDNTKVNSIVAATLAATQHDVVLVIVNDPVYGGSGGAIAVASTNVQAVELILHEEGHSFGLLGDEYGGPPPPACNNTVEPSSPNITKETQRALIKWTVWIDPGTPIPSPGTGSGIPGLYEGAGYCDTGLYRPTFDSKMRFLGKPFEQINSEQLVKRTYNFAKPLDSSAPSAASLVLSQGQTQSFTVTTPQPFTHDLTIRWLVDGQQQATGATFVLNTTGLALGTHSVNVAINDPTSLVRNDPNQVLKAQRTWSVRVDPTSGTPTPAPTLTPTPTPAATPTPPATPTPTPTPIPTTLGNIATRLRVGTGDNAMIGGFIITGTQNKTVIVRGIGPSLAVPGALADPIIEVHDSSGQPVAGATNDNWNDAATRQEIINSGLAPAHPLESALWGTISPGAYTVVVRGQNNATGVGLFEVYDLDRTVDSKLANISTRGFVDTGDNVMIGGTIIVGSAPTSVLIRAIGPSLSNFGVPNALADPVLELHGPSGFVTIINNNWRETQEAQIIATGIPPSNNLESAILVNLLPGPYTAIVRGANNTTGVALVEAYQLQ